MGIEDRKLRDRAAQRRLIIATARALAEKEGWEAVTTRRLAAEIEYSQPVLYKHFASMEDVVETIALEGFEQLAEALGAARHGGGTPEDALSRTAHAFTSFARDNPALFDAMFMRATRLRFGPDDAVQQLSAAFSQLRESVAAVAGERDVDTLTEVFWAALHGLATLDHNVRLRPEYGTDRIELLVAQFAASQP